LPGGSYSSRIDFSRIFTGTPAGGCVIRSVLRNAAKDAAFMLAAVAAKDAALEYRNDSARNTQPPASQE
jgi:hypothetical protein